jgi:HD superfamily phosphodiesterase
MLFATVGTAWALFRALDAPPALMRHSELVLEAAELLLDRMAFLRVPVDAELVRIGVVIHDAGKILHPTEISGWGNRHEEAGQALLLSHGVPSAIARICVTHARWDDQLPEAVTLEEFLVALADRLWKGRRDLRLEERVVSRVAHRLEVDTWDLFIPMDTLFESIASGGDDRLERSRV